MEDLEDNFGAKSTLVDALKELRNLHPGTDKNLAVLCEDDEGLRTAMAEMMGKVFQGTGVDVVDFENPTLAIDFLRQSTRLQSLAVVVTDLVMPKMRGDDFARFLRNNGASPAILLRSSNVQSDHVRGSLFIDDENASKAYAEGFIDVLAEKSQGGNSAEMILRETIALAIRTHVAKVLAVKEHDAKAKEPFLSSFFSDACERVARWDVMTTSVLGTKEDEEKDLDTIRRSIEELQLMLEGSAGLEWKENSTNVRKFIHDVNNKLAVVVTIVAILLHRPKGLTQEDVGQLKKLKEDVDDFTALIKKIGDANKGVEMGWAAVVAHRRGAEDQEDQVLKIPEGLKICVVDDLASIVRACESKIHQARGIASTAKDEESLELALKAGGADVVLLDNDLGNGLRGHQLIEAIRTLAPSALIIGHSSDAAGLNSDSGNPYAQAGVPIVDKLEWNAVTKIIAAQHSAES